MAVESKLLQVKQRDYWFDNIKGLLMIMVVIGHMIASFYSVSGVMKYIYDFINSLHMGAFLILSGYMSKRRIDQKDYISVINKNIVPYITAQLLLYFSAVILPDGLKAANSTYFDRSDFSFFIPIYQLWYLMAVIIFVLVTMKIKPARRPVLFMAGAIAMTLICGALPQINVFKLTKVISYYPFYLLGYLLPKDFMLTIRNKWQVIVGAVAVFIGYAYFMTRQDWIVGIRNIYGLSSNYEKVGELYGGLHPAFGRLIMVLAVPVVAFALYALIPRKKMFLSKLGQNSMYIFVLHSLVVVPVRCLNYEYKIFSYFTTPWSKLLLLLFCVAVTFLLGTDFIKKIFKPILEPNFDIINVVGSLYEKYKAKAEADKV